MAEKSLGASAPRRRRHSRPLAPVLTLVHDRNKLCRDSVVAELQSLLVRAIRGECIGMAYVMLKPDSTVDAALVGDLSRAHHRQRAVGALFQAAMSAAYVDEEA